VRKGGHPITKGGRRKKGQPFSVAKEKFKEKKEKKCAFSSYHGEGEGKDLTTHGGCVKGGGKEGGGEEECPYYLSPRESHFLRDDGPLMEAKGKKRDFVPNAGGNGGKGGAQFPCKKKRKETSLACKEEWLGTSEDQTTQDERGGEHHLAGGGGGGSLLFELIRREKKRIFQSEQERGRESEKKSCYDVRRNKTETTARGGEKRCRPPFQGKRGRFNSILSERDRGGSWKKEGKGRDFSPVGGRRKVDSWHLRGKASVNAYEERRKSHYPSTAEEGRSNSWSQVGASTLWEGQVGIQEEGDFWTSRGKSCRKTEKVSALRK